MLLSFAVDFFATGWIQKITRLPRRSSPLFGWVTWGRQRSGYVHLVITPYNKYRHFLVAMLSVVSERTTITPIPSLCLNPAKTASQLTPPSVAWHRRCIRLPHPPQVETTEFLICLAGKDDIFQSTEPWRKWSQTELRFALRWRVSMWKTHDLPSN